MIISVTYARLYALPKYENERFEATASVENGDVALAWEEARMCVETQHQRWLMDQQTDMYQQTAMYQPLPQPTAMPVPASDKQRSYIAMLQSDLGWSSEQLAAYANEQRIDLVAMTKEQASTFISGLKALAEERSLPF